MIFRPCFHHRVSWEQSILSKLFLTRANMDKLNPLQRIKSTLLRINLSTIYSAIFVNKLLNYYILYYSALLELMLEMSAFHLVTVANLHFQLSWYNQITLLPPPTQHHSFFRNFHLDNILKLVAMAKSQLRKKQSECPDLPWDYQAL